MLEKKKIHTVNGTDYEEIDMIYTVSSTIYAFTSVILAEKKISTVNDTTH